MVFFGRPLQLKQINMKTLKLKTPLLILFCFLITESISFAQTTIFPADTAIHYQYLKNNSLFHKISWVDKSNQTTREAVLNLVTRIDSIKHTITYLQIRNDGKKDSSVSVFPGLIPISLVSKGNDFKNKYDYYEDRVVVHAEKKGQPTFDGRKSVKKGYFDSYLSELILSTLPVEKLQPLQFYVFDENKRDRSLIEITKINLDVIAGPNGHNTPIYILNVKSGAFDFLVFLDKATRQMIKTVYGLNTGGYFVKEKI
ncbi:MAG: hypothetical protein JWR05_967 [Mucilaginibacter sp.]|nr:hypothetical protein [Mucilaginibacter sp.]